MIQVFDWQSEDRKTQITFRVTEIINAILRDKIPAKCITTLVEEEYAAFLIATREPNMAHVTTMPTSFYTVPIIGVEMPDDTVLIIDGTHRYIAHYMRKDLEIKAILVPFASLEPYLTLTGEPLL